MDKYRCTRCFSDNVAKLKWIGCNDGEERHGILRPLLNLACFSCLAETGKLLPPGAEWDGDNRLGRKQHERSGAHWPACGWNESKEAEQKKRWDWLKGIELNVKPVNKMLAKRLPEKPEDRASWIFQVTMVVNASYVQPFIDYLMRLERAPRWERRLYMFRLWFANEAHFASALNPVLGGHWELRRVQAHAYGEMAQT